MAATHTTPSLTAKFETNVPETISLQFAEGREVQSRFSGDQIMYTLTDGRRMYVDPYVARKIEAAGIGAHQPFQITKREITNGNRRTVDFEIRNLALASPNPPTPIANGHSAPPAAPAWPATEPGAIAALRVAAIAAIDVTLSAEEYARSKGMVDFQFGAENIQKIWMSLFIDLRRNGGRA